VRPHDEMLRKLVAEQAAEWHVAQSEGRLSPQLARDFMAWLRTSPTHVAEYLAIESVAKDLSESARSSTASWQDLLTGNEDPVLLLRSTDELSPSPVDNTRAGHTTSSRRASRQPILRWTAAAAVLAGFAILLVTGWRWFALKPDIAIFATHHGEERSLQLLDGSFVQLDSDSAITARFDRDNRQVVVDRGQVYFKVAKDPARPFSVQVGHSLVRDIGTAFDVYRHASDAAVTVAEGRVQVWKVQHPPGKVERWLHWFNHGRGSRGTLVADLGAGQQVLLTSTGQVKSLGKVDVQRTLAWRQGRIEFDSQAISSVAAEFNRYNALQISVAPRVGALPISGVFDAHDVPTFIAFLGSLPNVEVEQHDKRVLVSARHQIQQHR